MHTNQIEMKNAMIKISYSKYFISGRSTGRPVCKYGLDVIERRSNNGKGLFGKNENAIKPVAYLENHIKIENVFYPGIK